VGGMGGNHGQPVHGEAQHTAHPDHTDAHKTGQPVHADAQKSDVKSRTPVQPSGGVLQKLKDSVPGKGKGK
jgi:hypothetical protein